jgi:hypothetical protein
MLYQIQGTIKRGGVVRQFPTFYLDSDVQGIVSDQHAKKIAEEVLNPFGDYECSCFATAVPINIPQPV